MNYTELRAAIPAWLDNYSTEFDGQIDLIIKLAEHRLVREADLRAFRKHSTATLIQGDPLITTPTDTLVVRYLRLNTGDFLEYRSESWMSEYNQTKTTQGTPKYYGHWDARTLFVAPAPNSTATIELSYLYKPTTIVSASTTWLGDNAPDALLSACVYEAGIFLQVTQDILSNYLKRYMEALASLKDHEARNLNDNFMSPAA